jgi:hypothetical protein
MKKRKCYGNIRNMDGMKKSNQCIAISKPTKSISKKLTGIRNDFF